ncbi:hypothetical protein L6452_36403 [Arctium lappa]|uniref:Uncharacterized protein n=1 Tax=Arctium lappa TaxID=4217 RepID=A0ACB8Y945_ARCLA|nr:hypothetical protein L6452_36403 [Arctium lappa]
MPWALSHVIVARCPQPTFPLFHARPTHSSSSTNDSAIPLSDFPATSHQRQHRNTEVSHSSVLSSIDSLTGGIIARSRSKSVSHHSPPSIHSSFLQDSLLFFRLIHIPLHRFTSSVLQVSSKVTSHNSEHFCSSVLHICSSGFIDNSKSSLLC